MKSGSQFLHLYLFALFGFSGASTVPGRAVPVYGSQGPRSKSDLKWTYDQRYNLDNADKCFVSLEKGGGSVNFQIPLAEITIVTLYNSYKDESLYPIKGIDIYGCRQTVFGESCCRLYGPVEWASPHAVGIMFPPEGHIADEIRVVHNPSYGDAHIEFCEIAIQGNIKEDPHVGEFEETAAYVDIRGGVGPPPLKQDYKNIQQVFDGELYQKEECYFTNKDSPGYGTFRNKAVQLFFDRAKVEYVDMLTALSEDDELMTEMEDFKVSACNRLKPLLECTSCSKPTPWENNKKWYASQCNDTIADEIHITRDVKEGDLNADMWLCEVRVIGAWQKKTK